MVLDTYLSQPLREGKRTFNHPVCSSRRRNSASINSETLFKRYICSVLFCSFFDITLGKRKQVVYKRGKNTHDLFHPSSLLLEPAHKGSSGVCPGKANKTEKTIASEVIPLLSCARPCQLLTGVIDSADSAVSRGAIRG